MNRIALIVAGAALCGVIAVAQPAPAHACQYLGTNYPVQYDCTENQPWLPYGTPGNPPAGSGATGAPSLGTSCAPPHQHDMGCTG